MELVLDLVNDGGKIDGDLGFDGSSEIQKIDRIQKSFDRFHREHPEVLGKLISLARESKDRGFKRMGIAALFEIYRWDARLPLNNNFRSRYARKIMEVAPDLQGFFETRALLVN